jgi:protein-S-isoprenylcysteine O-methyltransferase Ste14
MDYNFIALVLVLIIYFPIFILGFFYKDFRLKFMRVHSKNFFQILIEVLVGLNYFLIMYFAFFSEFSSDLFVLSIGGFFYLIFVFLTFFGYYSFLKTKRDSFTKRFPYNISRNPTYFFGLLGVFSVSFMVLSLSLLVMVLIQFVLTHMIILNEEIYCAKRYDDYLEYKKRVRRYI